MPLFLINFINTSAANKQRAKHDLTDMQMYKQKKIQYTEIKKSLKTFNWDLNQLEICFWYVTKKNYYIYYNLLHYN